MTNPSSSALLRRAPTDPRELTVENYMFTPIQVFYSVHDPGILRLYVAGEIPINVPQAKRFEKYPMRGVEMAAAFADDMLASLGSRGFRVWQSRPLCGGEINRQATYLTLSAFWEVRLTFPGGRGGAWDEEVPGTARRGVFADDCLLRRNRLSPIGRPTT